MNHLPVHDGDPLQLQRVESYDYELPPGRIARYPVERRDGSRLLVVPRNLHDEAYLDGQGRSVAARPVGLASSESFTHLEFTDFKSLIRSGDLLVLNESRVLPARLLGRKPTGAECEVLLLRPIEGGEGPLGPTRWEALVRPGSKLKPGREVIVSPDLTVLIEGPAPGGGRIVRLETGLPVYEALDLLGRMPLPPYLDREDEPLDRERYQTVYARIPGSVAAPTAGLHFTPGLLEALEARGVRVARVTLHVGPGTFRPVDAEWVGDHEMHREFWRVPDETAQAIHEARRRGGRVWAVGTTVVRTLESAAKLDGTVRPGSGDTDLFITPGYRFKVVDGLITNFHLPRSTLLMLVAAFAGHRTTFAAYALAVDAGYRFYSYGDAMVVSPFDRERER